AVRTPRRRLVMSHVLYPVMSAHVRRQIVRRERHGEWTYAERIVDGVGDRSNRRPERAFADAERLVLRARQQLGGHFGDFGEPQDRIILPGGAGDAKPVE